MRQVSAKPLQKSWEFQQNSKLRKIAGQYDHE
jgi:hypothetical protein